MKTINELSLNELIKLERIFERKGWAKEDSLGNSFFDQFCVFLSSLSNDQRKLLLTLTENYVWIASNSEYVRMFFSVFSVFIKSFAFNGRKNIIICPLIREVDFGKSKSAIVLLYYVKGIIQLLQEKYSTFNLTYLDTPSQDMISKFKDNSVFCLIDDFIGSGNTALEAVDYYRKFDCDSSSFAILSLVAMKEGIEQLQKYGYSTYTCITENKGITGSGRDEETEKRIMQEIENKLAISPEFQFGRYHSEALVTMIRTPNNTFPVYWYNKKGSDIRAPFPR